MSTVTSSAAPAGTPTAPRDFPAWCPPMLVKELRQGLRTRGFVGAFVIFQTIMVIAMFVGVAGSGLGSAASRAMAAAQITGFFWTLLAVQLLVVTPSRALGSLKTEVDTRSLDLLMLTRLTAWRIVVGKWASLVAQAALLLVAMVPYGMVRYFSGSVDLVNDAKTCLAMLAGCAVATALCLWGWGLPRLLQLGVPVVLAGSLLRPLAMMFGGGGSSPFSGVDPWLWYFDGGLALFFFLVAAVRRIAPAAENHALVARGVPLLSLVPVPMCLLWGGHATAQAQLGVAGFFLALVCGIDLASARTPRPSHWLKWASRGALARTVGRYFLPGWPSALLFTLAVAGVVESLGWLVTMGTSEFPRFEWLVLLALGGLVFPVVIMSLFESLSSKAPAAWYGLTIGGMSLLAAMSAVFTSIFGSSFEALATIARVLPVSGFWLSLGKMDYSGEVMVAQSGIILALVVVALVQSRWYWRGVALFEVRRQPVER